MYDRIPDLPILDTWLGNVDVSCSCWGENLQKPGSFGYDCMLYNTQFISQERAFPKYGCHGICNLPKGE